MSKRSPGRPRRFNKEEKLAIVQEGEKVGVKAVCAMYRISDQTFRVWRYKARGIQPKKVSVLPSPSGRRRGTLLKWVAE